MKGGWEGRGRKRGSCVVSLYVKRLAELQSPLSEQVLTTWRPPSLPLTLFFLPQMAERSVRRWPFTPVDRWDYYLPSTHSEKHAEAFLSSRADGTPRKSHTHMCIPHTRVHTHRNTPFFVASSSARLPCGQTKEKTFCIN